MIILMMCDLQAYYFILNIYLFEGEGWSACAHKRIGGQAEGEYLKQTP